MISKNCAVTVISTNKCMAVCETLKILVCFMMTFTLQIFVAVTRH